jgi:cytochrome c
MMKSAAYLFAGAILALAPLASAGQSAQNAAPPAGTAPAAKNPVKPTAESQAKAKQLYSIDCALCHNDNGNGKTDVASSMGLKLADMTDANALAAMSDQEIFNLIRNGKDKMPAEDAGRAKDTDLWNLVIYLRSLSKPAAPGK